MGSKRNVDMSATTDTIKIVQTEEPTTQSTDSGMPVGENQPATNGDESPEAAKAVKKKPTRTRSKGYVAQRAQVDRTKSYDPFAAIELVKRLSYTKFDGTITVDCVVKEVGQQAEVTLPHSTGKTVRVAIVTDELLSEIEAGKIDFDVLVASPEFMPKLTKHARVLGPKGLMPNPKSGTVTSKPEEKKKELEKGKLVIKTEKKHPVIHVAIGKVSMDTKHLVENMTALLDALKGKIEKMTISASMSPGVKVSLG
jgi:large subunit ribosomal protein L1